MTDHVHERMATQRIVLTIPEMEAITVHRDAVYRSANGRIQTMDIYQPPIVGSTPPWPVVVLVTGFSDAGAEQRGANGAGGCLCNPWMHE